MRHRVKASTNPVSAEVLVEQLLAQNTTATYAAVNWNTTSDLATCRGCANLTKNKRHHDNVRSMGVMMNPLKASW